MHTVLVIDQSKLMINYLSDVLQRYSFDIIYSTTVKDGLEKIRIDSPELVITDFNMPDLAGEELLDRVNDLANVYGIPVILLSSQVDMGLLVNIARYKQKFHSLKRFMTKPLKIDSLLFTISRLLKIKIAVDKTPCKLDVNLNDDMIFIDLSHGFNSDKIKLLKYKLIELKEIYQVPAPKILVIMYDLKLDRSDLIKIDLFFDIMLSFIIINYPLIKEPSKTISVLSMVKEVRQFTKNHPVYRNIAVSNNLDDAIESFTHITDAREYKPVIEEQKLEYFTTLLKSGEEGQMIDMHYDHSSVSKKRDLYICCVDHDIDIQNRIEARLSRLGYTVKLFTEGANFLRKVSNKKPDLLILSMDLEEVTGQDVLGKLQSNKMLPTMAIIATSSVMDETVVDDVKSFGINDYLQLPFEDEDDFDFFEELVTMIDAVEKHKDETAGKQIMEEGVVIAIVDDDETIREYMKMIFATYSLKIKLYKDGLEFVESLNGGVPNLLFLDLLMPNMNGLQVLSWLEKKGYDFPVVVFSALSKTETVRKALDFGIRSYILKPPGHVNVIINKTLEILGSQF